MSKKNMYVRRGAVKKNMYVRRGGPPPYPFKWNSPNVHKACRPVKIDKISELPTAEREKKGKSEEQG